MAQLPVPVTFAGTSQPAFASRSGDSESVGSSSHPVPLPTPALGDHRLQWQADVDDQSAKDGAAAAMSAIVVAAVAAQLKAEASTEDEVGQDHVESCSVSSEWECPVCYQLYCEPVRAGCERHVFCRNCLLKSQRLGSTSRCPICRAESQLDATDIPEVAELAERLRRRDYKYEERVSAARSEREEHLQVRLWRMVSSQEQRSSRMVDEARSTVRAWMPLQRSAPTREVCGAGSEEVNGLYMAGVLPTYVGPTVYRKPNTFFFIFRWQQTQWAIAELRGSYSMGNERAWMYRAPTQHPPDVPPTHGWEVPTLGRACSPAPEVRFVQDLSRRVRRVRFASNEEQPGPRGPTGVQPSPSRGSVEAARRRRRDGTTSETIVTANGVTSEEAPVDVVPREGPRWEPNAGQADMQVRASCRCTPACNVM